MSDIPSPLNWVSFHLNIKSLCTSIMSYDKSLKDMDDIKYVEEAEETVATDAERMAAEKALVRKVDLYLLPCVWIMYLLSYMDVC